MEEIIIKPIYKLERIMTREFSDEKERYLITAPFYLNDGDSYVIYLVKEKDDKWTLTDDGNTLFQLGNFDLDDPRILKSNTFNKFIERSLKQEDMTIKGAEIRKKTNFNKLDREICYFYKAIMQIAAGLEYALLIKEHKYMEIPNDTNK